MCCHRTTQRKRELDEEELDLHRAIAADCELQYESDGSNEGKVVQGARTVPVRSLDSPVAALPDKLLVTPTPAAWTQNADLPPWSQRAASYPPWSARSAPPSALRSATCPGSSQRGATEASQRFLGKMIDRRSSCPNSEQREEDVHEQEREDEKRDVPLDETILSQLSSRCKLPDGGCLSASLIVCATCTVSYRMFYGVNLPRTQPYSS